MDNKTLWNACKIVLDKEKQPLELSRGATAAKLPEETVAARLIEYANDGRSITFRFPPLPTAAILSMSNPG